MHQTPEKLIVVIASADFDGESITPFVEVVVVAIRADARANRTHVPVLVY